MYQEYLTIYGQGHESFSPALTLKCYYCSHGMQFHHQIGINTLPYILDPWERGRWVRFLRWVRFQKHQHQHQHQIILVIRLHQTLVNSKMSEPSSRKGIDVMGWWPKCGVKWQDARSRSLLPVCKATIFVSHWKLQKYHQVIVKRHKGYKCYRRKLCMRVDRWKDGCQNHVCARALELPHKPSDDDEP